MGTSLRSLSVLTLAGAMLSAPALAEDPDTSFEANKQVLEAQGFHDVEMVGGDSLRLTAIDSNGLEVLIWVDPQSTEISMLSHLRPAKE